MIARLGNGDETVRSACRLRRIGARPPLTTGIRVAIFRAFPSAAPKKGGARSWHRRLRDRTAEIIISLRKARQSGSWKRAFLFAFSSDRRPLRRNFGSMRTAQFPQTRYFFNAIKGILKLQVAERQDCRGGERNCRIIGRLAAKPTLPRYGF